MKTYEKETRNMKDKKAQTTIYTIVDLINGVKYETTNKDQYQLAIHNMLDNHNWTIFGYTKRAMVVMSSPNTTIIGRC